MSATKLYFLNERWCAFLRMFHYFLDCSTWPILSVSSCETENEMCPEAVDIIKLELLLRFLTDFAVIGTVEKLFSAAMV